MGFESACIVKLEVQVIGLAWISVTFIVSRSQCKVTFNDEYILFVALLAAILLVKAMKERH